MWPLHCLFFSCCRLDGAYYLMGPCGVNYHSPIDHILRSSARISHRIQASEFSRNRHLDLGYILTTCWNKEQFYKMFDGKLLVVL